MPGGEEQIPQVADMIVVVVGEQDGRQFVWRNPCPYQLGGHAAPSVNQHMRIGM